MAKRIKMVLYGEPGVGKSTFAAKAPNPFFITTDGNYEWLGLPEKDHKQVFNWEEAKKAFAANYKGYDTIVVDLTEDLYKYNEADYCRRNDLQYVGDDGYGKGWRITKDDFFLEIAKLLGQDKNIILIMHETSTTKKDRKGVEHTKYIPSTRIPDAVIDQIEGRVRYFLRCYMKPEAQGDKVVKRRFLSVVPKENEFGIARGIDEYAIPHDIDLDWNTFVSVIGFEEAKKVEVVQKDVTPVKEVVDVQPVKEEPVKEEPAKKEPVNIGDYVEEENNIPVTEEPVKEEPKVEEPKTESTPAQPVEQPVAEESRDERLARLRARLKDNNNK